MEKKITAVVCALAMCVLYLMSCSQADPAESMAKKITWYGISAVKIKAEKTVYLDPSGMIPSQLKDPADIIFITHSHDDHYSASNIKAILKDTTKIICPESVADRLKADGITKNIVLAVPGRMIFFSGMEVKPFLAYSQLGHEKADGGLGFLIDYENVKILFTGSSGLNPELKAFTGVDLAFASLVDGYAMTGDEILAFAGQIKPKYLFPVHWTLSREVFVKSLIPMAPKDVKLIVLEQAG
jgi:L-ascorbate metabolism protein UlaG (beta-lactamase superfamily)